MLQSPRAVSLDLDNTLWDTPPVLERAEAELQAWLSERAPRLVERFDRPSLARLRALVAAELPHLSHDFTFVRTESLRRAALETGYAESLAHDAFEIFISARNRIDLFDEVPGALAWLSRRLPVYALTNGNACVYRVGVGNHFAGSFAPADVGFAKPDERIFAALAAAAGVPTQAIWHVGDDPEADVLGAQRSGMIGVWMNRTQAVWPSALPLPDLEVRDMDELVAKIEATLTA
jgi:putative hydrolase of the HAD superfamily